MRFYLRKRSSHSVTLTDSAWTRRMMSPLAGLHEEALHGHEARHRPNCSHAPECRGPRTVGHVVRPAPPGREQVGADRHCLPVTRPTGCPRSWPAAGCRPERTLMRSRPLPIDFVRFPCSRPRRHRHADRLQWFMAEGPKLEQSPHRNRKTGAAFQRDDLFAFSLLAPHLTAAFQEVPNLFHGSMSDCAGRPAGTEFEVGHSTSLEAQEDPDIRAVRSDVVSCHWEPFGLELHPSPPSDPRCPSRLGILP